MKKFPSLPFLAKRLTAIPLFFGIILTASFGLADYPELERLKNLKGGKDHRAEESAARDRAQLESAYRLAVQTAANLRYQEILHMVVEPREEVLDSVFDFRGLLLKHGEISVLPPVISEAGEALRIDEGGKSASFQTKSFLLLSGARIVSGPPDWRRYLYLDLKNPEEVHPTLLPASLKERESWKERIERGFQAGLEQGDILFKNQVALLTRDFLGLLLYEELKGEKRLKEPSVKDGSQERVSSPEELVLGVKRYELVTGGSFSE
ncbi:MAG: type IV secretory system conjugative DNA transfer family protein [Deltaproteobacteria bacterium]|jgi:hypothetical protein|nr:type IV secretory system conjugative DNA transfer family protein [Deltaproteobacteria bacterium]